MEPLELSLLEVLNTYGEISQREISQQVGISLGMVNLLINKFAKVGLVKIEKLNGKKIRYILTPKGFSVLSKKTIDYISRSYTAVLKIKSQLSEVIDAHYASGEPVAIYGARDEVFHVLLEVLKEQGRGYSLIEDISSEGIFVHWDETLDQGVFLLGYQGGGSKMMQDE